METCQILYATQSGRAKACARRAARVLGERTTISLTSGTSADDGMRDLHEFAASARQQSSLIILFVSTTGDGEHTDSMQHSWKQL
jgi:flavodoxin